MARQLVLLTYNLRDGVDPAAYDEWIRTAEYRNFRRQPEIKAHSCWRITQQLNGREQFTFFDLMEINSIAEYQEVMARQDVVDHATDWLARWSFAGPDAADMTQNWTGSFAEEIWG